MLENSTIIVFLVLWFAIIIKLLHLYGYKKTFFASTIFGTFCHELAHFSISFVTFGKPRNISIIPKREANGYTLGYVESHNINFLNKGLIGMAPLLLLPVGYYVYISSFNDDLPLLCLKAFILSNLIYSSMPSSTDFRVAGLFQSLIIISGGFFASYTAYIY